jgi:hypothetical protein
MSLHFNPIIIFQIQHKYQSCWARRLQMHMREHVSSPQSTYMRWCANHRISQNSSTTRTWSVMLWSQFEMGNEKVSWCLICVKSVLVTFLWLEMPPCFPLLELWDPMVVNWAKYYWISWQNTVGSVINCMLIAWEHVYLQTFCSKVK